MFILCDNILRYQKIFLPSFLSPLLYPIPSGNYFGFPSFNNYLLRTYYMIGAILGVENIVYKLYKELSP